MTDKEGGIGRSVEDQGGDVMYVWKRRVLGKSERLFDLGKLGKASAVV